jgi:hypothetical protein
VATIIYPGGTEEAVAPANGEFFEYAELRKIVGSSLDTLPTKDYKILFFCGQSQEPRNIKAMELAGLAIEPEIMEEADYIHGTVLVCEQGELRTGQKRG